MEKVEVIEVIALAQLTGNENMALDAALLSEAEGKGAIGWRVYGWNGPWISLGMNQDPTKDLVDPDVVPWVMRPTGGKAVLHGHDVTVGFAVPLTKVEGRRSRGEEPDGYSKRSSRSVRAVYRWMTAPIVEALIACGLPAALAEDVAGTATAKLEGEARSEPLANGIVQCDSDGASPSNDGPKNWNQESGIVPDQRWRTQSPISPDCFKLVSPNDIVDARTMQKCCGCALRITKTAALLQASIPAGKPLIDPARVFAHPSSIRTPDWSADRFAEAFEAALQRCSV